MDVEDLIMTSLHMHGVDNMVGVISCHTTYSQLTNQRICNLEVTEALADIFEVCGRILSGPVGQLTFRLRSGDDNGTTVELMHMDETVSPVSKIKIVPTCEELLDDSSVNESNASIDTDLLDSSNTTLTPLSPAGSETESFTNTLGHQFQLLGCANEDWNKLNDDSLQR